MKEATPPNKVYTYIVNFINPCYPWATWTASVTGVPFNSSCMLYTICAHSVLMVLLNHVRRPVVYPPLVGQAWN